MAGWLGSLSLAPGPLYLGLFLANARPVMMLRPDVRQRHEVIVRSLFQGCSRRTWFAN